MHLTATLNSGKTTLEPIARLIPITYVDSARMLTFARYLQEEKKYLEHKVRIGAELHNTWSFVPRVNHRLTYKKTEDHFRDLCACLRGYYRSTLVFRINP